MPSLYEVRIAGPIGPLIHACLPGFALVTAAESTMLTGIASGPDHLQQVLDLLAENGQPADNVRLRAKNIATVTTQYEIRVTGKVAAEVVEHIGDVRATPHPVETVLRGYVDDQAALNEMINHLQGLGLELLEVRQLTT